MGIFSFHKLKKRLNNNRARHKADRLDYTDHSNEELIAVVDQTNKSFHSMAATMPPAPDPSVDPAAYLRSIYAVRERCKLVMAKARSNELQHFTVDQSKFPDTANYVVSIIKASFTHSERVLDTDEARQRDFEPHYHKIPPHGRWQHFDVGNQPRVDDLIQSWPSTVDKLERTRRLIDLFLVSVLLDAGAGNKWEYRSKIDGSHFKRSEGLAVASLDMFKEGLFSNDPSQPCRVDSEALRKLTPERMGTGLQVTAENPIEGLEGRTNLLVRLADALGNKEIFGTDARPGNLLDYILAQSTTDTNSVPTVLLPTLWDALMQGLYAIWPATRTQINGVSLGDAWPCEAMPNDPKQPWQNIVPFHKLTQWLTYSLMVPMQKLAGIHFVGVELMTGLPEYRNGGLLVDTGLLTLKPKDTERGLQAFEANAKLDGQPDVEVVPLFSPDDDVIIEWRALTVGFLDQLLVEVNRGLGLSGSDQLNLAQMLEAGSWKGGREIAQVTRPYTKGPPIMILSDGTVF